MGLFSSVMTKRAGNQSQNLNLSRPAIWLNYCLNNSKTMGIGGKQHDWEHSLHRNLRGILFVVVSGPVARLNAVHLFPEVNRRCYA